MHPIARLAVVAVAALSLAACGNRNEVGSVGVDWTGNDISIEAVADPDVDGVVCHLSFFNRSFIDRLSQGNWFEDPSYSALGVQDITQLGKLSASSSFLFFETYNVVAFLYLTMTISLSLLVRWLERVMDGRAGR